MGTAPTPQDFNVDPDLVVNLDGTDDTKISENNDPVTVNNALRALASVFAILHSLPTSAGTADAQTITSGFGLTADTTGFPIWFKAGAGLTNTGAMTVSVDSIGAAAVKMPDGTDPVAGAVTAGGIYKLTYDGTNYQLNSLPAVVGSAASESAAGIIEIATDAEAQAKSAGDRALVPSNLAALAASLTFAGLVELATTAETTTGADATRATTPAGVSAALAAAVSDYLPLAGGTMVGTIAGFTSTGIDDNATGERLQLTDTTMALGDGSAAENFRINLRTTTDGYLNLAGGSAINNGGEIRLFGQAHASGANDINIRSGNASVGYWDYSQDRWEWQDKEFEGVGGLDLTASTALSFAGTDILADAAGVTTLSNIDALDATTLATIEAALAAATTSVAGLVELATDAEAQAKTDGTRALTPDNLAALVASLTFAGLVELATAAETSTGTDDTRAVTPAGLASVLAGYAASSHNHAASDINSGTLADARVAQSNVTQHEAALTVTESQISDLGSYIADITAEPLSDLSDVTITAIAAGELLKWNGSAWINQTLAEAGVDSASATVAGLVELATDAEAQAKADATRALTPDNLAALAASLTFAGLVELATSAETATGSDATRAVTPAGAAATYEPIDADLLRADTEDILVAGFETDVDDDGAQSSGTYTPEIGDAASNCKEITSDGFTALGEPVPSANDTELRISVWMQNTASAATVSLAAFDKVTGDDLTTTNGDEFYLEIKVIDIGGTHYSHLHITALQ